jgi:ketosteroid isomerase-like protein
VKGMKCLFKVTFLFSISLLSFNVKAVEIISLEETNKLIVKEFFDKYGKDPSFIELVHPEVKWWVPETLPFGGDFESRQDYFQMLGENFIGFSNPMVLEIINIIADGNQVAVEVESNATHICGAPEPFHYNNKYHFSITLEKGKFVRVKEHNDTKHLLELYNLIQSEDCQFKLNE